MRLAKGGTGQTLRIVGSGSKQLAFWSGWGDRFTFGHSSRGEVDVTLSTGEVTISFQGNASMPVVVLDEDRLRVNEVIARRREDGSFDGTYRDQSGATLTVSRYVTGTSPSLSAVLTLTDGTLIEGDAEDDLDDPDYDYGDLMRVTFNGCQTTLRHNRSRNGPWFALERARLTDPSESFGPPSPTCEKVGIGWGMTFTRR